MKSKKPATIPIGQLGERLAVDYLCDQHYEIVEKNYRKPYGELDLVARDRGTLVFIEIKTRHSNRFGGPIEAVDQRKQRQLSRIAQDFLTTRRLHDVPARFDVIGVLLDRENRLLRIDHVRNAFDCIE